MSREIIVDNFAGGGGASTGIELATGRSVDIAINHDPAAIAMHRANHPTTKHYTEDVWKVDPAEACEGRPVGLAWFSPDCKHFSRAKGGKPVSKKIRGLAWVAVKWAKAVRPRVIMLENVEEFQEWGRLDADGRPDPKYKGETFRRFVGKLEQIGYRVEYRMLRACDYGAPTVRKRFFLIARCDGKRIVWPEAEFGDPESLEVFSGLKKPWKAVADILDFSLPCPSIFDSAEEIWEKYHIHAVRPLSENTLKRIAKGLMRFVVNSPKPFIVQLPDAASAGNLIQYHSERTENARGQSLDRPLMTVDASNRYALVTAFITQFNNHCFGQELSMPLNTVTAKWNHFGEVCAFLVKWYGQGGNIAKCSDPAPTITAKDRLGLVMVHGEQYRIADIGMRMLTPRELFNAQGFPGNYIIDVDADGNEYPRSEQVARCGNAVCPPVPAALVRANLPELCKAG